jgi:hypothetical protein
MFALATLSLGCASVKLTPEAEKVKVVKYLTTEELKNLTDIGFAECNMGANGNTRSQNEEACQNKLKNDTAAAGGTTLLLKETRQGTAGTAMEMMGAGNCLVCVVMNGVIYKQKSN